MPKNERHKTSYPGVYWIEGTDPATSKPEKVYYIVYRNREGKKDSRVAFPYHAPHRGQRWKTSPLRSSPPC